MKFSVDTSVAATFPGMRIGVVRLTEVVNRFDPELHAELQASAVQPDTSTIADVNEFDALPELTAWRAAYRQFGANPKRTRPSAEALLRRAVQGKPLPWISPLVNLYLETSIRYRIPIGGYDVSALNGNLLLRYSAGGEEFAASDEKTECTQDGEVVYADDSGVLTRCWNYRDGARARIENSTTDAVLICESPGLGFPDEAVVSAANELADRASSLTRCRASVAMLGPYDSLYVVPQER